ncbi:serine O-acetyltransferase [Aquihabitans sp. McL0605]|uniref:serine O-acetyltransferase n=1 Tax=Aquihabitans sp. McL0605 TaxID=3415671 RepID=UPI003CF19283
MAAPPSDPSPSDVLLADIAANKHDPKGLLLVVSYRVASEARRFGQGSLFKRLFVLPVLLTYRVVVEWVLGVELPAQVVAGPGLRIRHGQGLVVNTGTVLGANVMLRHNVTIGNIRRGPGDTTGCPTIGDDVELGAGAVVVGPITVGAGALIGANAVVSRDVPAGAVVRAPLPAVIEPTAPGGERNPDLDDDPDLGDLGDDPARTTTS